ARFARFSAWGQGLRMRSEAGDPSASINIYDAESLAGGIWAQHQRGKGVANAVGFNSRAEIHCGYYLAIHYDEVIIRHLVPESVQRPGSDQKLCFEGISDLSTIVRAVAKSIAYGFGLVVQVDNDPANAVLGQVSNAIRDKGAV